VIRHDENGRAGASGKQLGEAVCGGRKEGGRQLSISSDLTG